MKTNLFNSYLPLRQWREELGATKIEYSDRDFITPTNPEALLPYIIFSPSPGRAGRVVPL